MRRSPFRVVLSAAGVLALVNPVAHAQEVPAARAPGVMVTPPEPPRLAVITGEVLEIDTRVAVPRAVVTVKSTGGATIATVRTDARGAFEVGSLPAGTFVVEASKRGYLGFGETRARRESRQVVETTGRATTDDVELFLGRTAAIHGRVYDEFGEPVVDAQMVVLRERPVRGRRQWAVVRSPVPSNDLGDFRIAGLEPGAYLLRAMPREARNAQLPREPMPAPTYYPGTPASDEALRLDLGPGQELLANFPVGRYPAASISGAVFDDSGRPLAGASVVVALIVRGPNAYSAFGLSAREVSAADGSFTLEDVPPGEYEVRATSPAVPGGTNRGEGDTAQADVSVAGEPVNGVTLVIARGRTVTGRVVFDGLRPDDAAPRLTVTASPGVFGRRETATVGPDATFTFTAWVGARALRLGQASATSAAPAWVLSSIRAGGRDHPFAPIDVADAVQGLELVATRRLGAVTGQAQQLEPRSDYRAVVFPDDPGAWLFDSPRITSVPIPASGRFSVSGLLPGRYRVAIVEHLRPLLDEWFDVEWLERLQRLATMVEVEAGGAATVEVRPVEVPEG